MQEETIGAVVGSNPSPHTVCEDKRVLGSTLVGVEVELEGENLNRLIEHRYKYWSLHREGSIRNGVELVFIEPLGGVDVPRALRELEGSFKIHEVVPYQSPRASLHVHIDVREMTALQVRNVLLLYVILERVLFKVCGEDRYNNTFCSSSEFHDDVLLPLGTEGKELWRALRRCGNNRYLGINLGAIYRFGSVEFRGHRSAWESEVILNWINILLSIKQYALSNDFDFSTISLTVSEVGYEDFLRGVFGEYYPLIENPDNDLDILRGLRRAQDIVFRDQNQKADKQIRDEALALSVNDGNYSPLFNQLRNKP